MGLSLPFNPERIDKMSRVVLTKEFLNNVPDGSYINILKSKEGGMCFITIRTLDWKRVRATSCGENLQECIDELSKADMTLAPKIEPMKKVSVDDVLRSIWNKVKGKLSEKSEEEEN